MPSHQQDPCHFTFLPVFSFASVPDLGHSNMCVGVSCFNLHFPNDLWSRTPFHMLICHLYLIFGEESVKVFVYFWLFLLFLLSFKSSLCMLDNISLSDVSFTSVFSPSVAYLFILLMYFSSFAYFSLHSGQLLFTLQFLTSLLSYF